MGRRSTYVSAWSGWVYVAFVMDVHSRQIPGWRTARTMMTSLVADAIEHAIWTQLREGITYCLDALMSVASPPQARNRFDARFVKAPSRSTRVLSRSSRRAMAERSIAEQPLRRCGDDRQG
ncbi:DDE-type integrase/transposase/recombinase [Rhodococcus sp. IEGM 1241]|uniref:DDE-type integrase/transposase/recombinase n=1 Tax=Rhodococcus sp. IEGM 1241 TaxID=3082228 RepID=UPI003988C98E